MSIFRLSAELSRRVFKTKFGLLACTSMACVIACMHEHGVHYISCKISLLACTSMACVIACMHEHGVHHKS